jgi:hypothetical protein
MMLIVLAAVGAFVAGFLLGYGLRAWKSRRRRRSFFERGLSGQLESGFAFSKPTQSSRPAEARNPIPLQPRQEEVERSR